MQIKLLDFTAKWCGPCRVMDPVLHAIEKEYGDRVALQKIDVDEELDRLGSHVAEARRVFSLPEAVGRRLDFLMQEFMREANTLCSKSATTALTAVGLELKAVIEQLREQIQNVE